MIYTTLAHIRSHSPCEDGWEKLCKSLGGIRQYGKDTPVSLLQILDSNGLDDALWCLRACDADDFAREFSRWCALQVVHLWKPPAVVTKYLNTGDETLREAAWATARGAAGAAAWAAAGAAAEAAAWDAARGAAKAAQIEHLRDMLAAHKEAA